MPARSTPSASRTKIASSASSAHSVTAAVCSRTRVSNRATSAGSGRSSTASSMTWGTSRAYEELLHERGVVEVAAERADLVVAELGERRSGQHDVPSGRLDDCLVADLERAGVIRIDTPLGDRVVADEIDRVERDRDVR